MNDCEKCIHAEVTYGLRVIQEGNVTLYQNGGCNIRCTASGVSISFNTGGDMVCSGFQPREVKI